ncbi:hypothetical protein M1E11_03550 [Bacillus sp. JZ8]
MAWIIFCLFLTSFLLFAITGKRFMDLKKSASYPPKRVLRKRLVVEGGTALTVFLLALLLYYVT